MKSFVSILIILSFAMSACSTQRAYFEYSEFKEMPLKTEALTGSNLGMVRGEDGGAIWDNCTEKARGSVRELISMAKAKGATAIGEIKWSATNDSVPACKKGWGYLVIWPFVLTPLFMSTQVTGIAYKTGGKALLDLPTNPVEEEAFITYVTSLQN